MAIVFSDHLKYICGTIAAEHTDSTLPKLTQTHARTSHGGGGRRSLTPNKSKHAHRAHRVRAVTHALAHTVAKQ